MKLDIIYFGTLPSTQLIPKVHLARYARLENIMERCASNGRIYSSLNPSLSKFIENNSQDNSFYKPKFDIIFMNNNKILKRKGNSLVNLKLAFWRPTTNITAQFTCEEVLDPPNGVLIEGFKYAAERVIEVTDNSICTMCDTGKSFGNCCKAAHNERLMKAHKKGAKLIYCQNVLERHHIVGNPPYVTHRIGLMNFHTTKKI